MAKCPYYTENDCIALDLYLEDRYGNRYPYSPCNTCVQPHVKQLEEKIKNEEKENCEQAVKSTNKKADMVEVVRCKDCMHGADTIINGKYLFKTCGGVDHKPDWFCADGERRDGDA